MSIVKFINMHNNSKKDTADMHAYLSDDIKTSNGKYIDGLGFITDKYLDEFNAIKTANQKLCGNQFRQITISLSPAENNCSDEELMDIGRKIAQYHYQKGFQVIIYRHIDTYYPHFHLLLNTVNYKTGKKFSQSKRELNRYKVHCNHVLNDYGLDTIRMQTDELMDDKIHFIKDGFDCLEVFDEVVEDKEKIFEAPIVEITSRQQEDYNDFDVYNVDKYYGSDFTEDDEDIYEFGYSEIYEPETADQEEIIMKNTKENQELPTIAAPQLPDTMLNKTGLTIDCSKNVNIIVPNDYSNEKLADLINSVEPVSEEDRAFNAKLGVGSEAELQKRDLDIPVYVDTSTNINITFDSVLESDIFDISNKKK